MDELQIHALSQQT
jgi:uncharacterized protein (DUF486 family)